ncbi:MAG: hypothetical protein ABSA47_17655 [Verrucomicrobiota bacterium]
MRPWTDNFSRPALAAAISGFACLFGLLAAQGAPSIPSTNAAPDQLFLRDGDFLNGKLLDIDSKRTLRWQHADVADPIEFNLDSVSQIRFHPSAQPGSPEGSNTDHPCQVFLAGGDVLEGALVSYDRTNLCLQTWYAGLLSIPRGGLRSVWFPPVTPDVFALTGQEGWTQGNAAAAFAEDPGQWVFRDSAFYASKSASIARDVNLPAGADIQFDLAWSGALSLSMALYTDSLQPIKLLEKDTAPPFGGFYSLQFLPGLYVNLERVKQMEPRAALSAPVAVPTFGQTNRVRVQVRARKQSNIIALSVDGVLTQVWHDTNGFAGEGTGLRFVHNPGGLIKVSDLRITPWDGVLQEDQTNIPSSSQDIASLTNATSVIGQIVSVSEGKMTFRGKWVTNSVPIPQVRRLTFAGPKSEPSVSMESALHANLLNGVTLTFQLDRWAAGGVDIHSPVFGPARIRPDAFSRVVFPPPPEASTNGPR